MAQLQVEFAAAEATLASLRAARAEIAARLAALDGEVARLRGGWSGDAQHAYDVAHAQWSAQMTRMSGLLDSASSVLEEWLGGLRDLERDLAAMWPA